MTTGKRVLCIDDEHSGLMIRKALLEACGFTALTASSGREGLAIFKSHRVDAVLVDYSMPEMDGGKVCAAIKQTNRRTPVIMLTAYSSAFAAVSKVVDAFIEKGQDPTVLLQRLESLINLRSHIHPELRSEYVIFADSSRHYLDCSDGVCQLLGYSRAEILNLSVEDISYRSQDVITLFDEYRQRGKLDGEYVLRHKNGQPIRITYRSFVFPDGCMAAVWQPIKK